MRGITTLITTAGLFTVVLFVAVPVLDALKPIATERSASRFHGTIALIHESGVKWIVVVFLAVLVMWALYYTLRTERQQVRRP